MTHVLRETVDLEGISLFANWEMGRKAKTYKFLCIKKGGGGDEEEYGVGPNVEGETLVEGWSRSGWWPKHLEGNKIFPC